MSATQPAPLLGTVLVVGGCGFLGYHLVGHLLRDQECGPIYVLDCNVKNNRHDAATYIQGNLTDFDTVDALVKKIQPCVIFHAASPTAMLPIHRINEFHNTNITGTQMLLTIAAESETVRALVFTSTVDAYTGHVHRNVDETHPLWTVSSKTTEYNRTKAIAQRLVLEANGPHLRTVSLLPGHMYGERQSQGMSEALEACSGNRRLFRIGNGTNLCEVTSADNTATAHILAAKALLDSSRAVGKVDGESFNVSDASPVPFWYHIGLIWRTVRGEDALKNLIVIPAWVMVILVNLVECLLWVFTFNTLQPPVELRRLTLDYAVYDQTFSIQKARERLQFEPVANHDAVLAGAVRWELDRRQIQERNSDKETDSN